MIPRPIYEALPYLYLFVGMLAAFSLSGYGRACGVALVVIGLRVWIMRRTYRNRWVRVRNAARQLNR